MNKWIDYTTANMDSFHDKVEYMINLEQVNPKDQETGDTANFMGCF